MKKVLSRLYTIEKKSVSEIAAIFKCSENGVNYWIAKHGISKRSIAEAIYVKRNPKGDPFKDPGNIGMGEEFIYGLGLGLFWGEGYKKSKNAVRLGNTDPQLIRIFILFLDRIFKIKKSKLRFGIQIFQDLDKKIVKDYWVRALHIKPEQVHPSIVVSESLRKGTYKLKNKYGVLTVYFNNTKLKKMLDEHIEKIKKID